MKRFVKIVETWAGNNLSGPELELPNDLPKEIREFEAPNKKAAESALGAPVMSIEEYNAYILAKKESYGDRIRAYKLKKEREELKKQVGFFKRLWLSIKPLNDADSTVGNDGNKR